jgi:hypothetical protein
MKAKDAGCTNQGTQTLGGQAGGLVADECGFDGLEIIDELADIDLGNRWCDRMAQGLGTRELLQGSRQSSVQAN